MVSRDPVFRPLSHAFWGGDREDRGNHFLKAPEKGRRQRSGPDFDSEEMSAPTLLSPPRGIVAFVGPRAAPFRDPSSLAPACSGPVPRVSARPIPRLRSHFPSCPLLLEPFKRGHCGIHSVLRNQLIPESEKGGNDWSVSDWCVSDGCGGGVERSRT